MSKRPRRSLERALSQERTSASHREGNGFVHPSRVPGVRIVYIGRPTAGAEEIGAYWRARGATFVLHRPGVGTGGGELDRVLERADIVFLAADCVDRETERRIEARCDRLERPMIVLDEGSLWAVEQALRMWHPLARL
jgi:hypothetical protein